MAPKFGDSLITSLSFPVRFAQVSKWGCCLGPHPVACNILIRKIFYAKCISSINS